jgi:hypothetical protein
LGCRAHSRRAGTLRVPCQKYMKEERESRASKQTWGTFLRNHASQIWGGTSTRLDLTRGSSSVFRASRGDQREHCPSMERSPLARCSMACTTITPGWQQEALGKARPNA